MFDKAATRRAFLRTASAAAIASPAIFAPAVARAATKVTLPFVEEQIRRTKRLMGDDYWAYGVDASRPTLDAFLDAHHAQGLSKRRLRTDELFHPSTLETHKI